MTSHEATERLIRALLAEFEDRDDRDLIPLRRVMVDVGNTCGVPEGSYDPEQIPEWTIVGEFREGGAVQNRIRDVLAND